MVVAVGEDHRVDRGRGASEGVYSIGAVAKMLAVPAQTLRVWEDRYGLIVPVRSAGGQRLYSRDDVEQLRVIREHIESGLQPADAHRLLAEGRRTQVAGDSRMVRPGRADHPVAADRPDRFVILLAERDPYAAEFTDYFLRTEGYAARVVLDAEKAREVLDDDPPHLLVIDLMISGGAGLELCRTTRQRSPVPILAVSALAAGAAAVEAGADAFLQKPVDPLRFVSTVRDLLGTSAYLQRRAPAR